MWEGNERTFQKLEEKLIDAIMEEGFDSVRSWRMECPDLRMKARTHLKRDEHGLLIDPIVISFEIR